MCHIATSTQQAHISHINKNNEGYGLPSSVSTDASDPKCERGAHQQVPVLVTWKLERCLGAASLGTLGARALYISNVGHPLDGILPKVPNELRGLRPCKRRFALWHRPRARKNASICSFHRLVCHPATVNGFVREF